MLHLLLLLLPLLTIHNGVVVESARTVASERAQLASGRAWLIEALAGQSSAAQEVAPSSPPRRPLRIAQIAPLAESVPPKAYGGIERIIYYLVEEMAKRGHQVILFASPDSTETSAAELVSHSNWSMVDRQNRWEATRGLFEWQIHQLNERIHEFDIVHFHYMPFQCVDQKYHNKVVSTLHDVISFPPDLPQLFNTYKDVSLVSISNDQRTHLPDQSVRPNYGATIYNGIPEDLYQFTAKPEGKPYLAFLGRISRNKGPDWAIQIAAISGIPLKIAAKLEAWLGDEGDYWRNVIQPLLAKYGHMVEFIGEINDQQKGPFLGNAVATLFPIDWEEPFGMVMTESMACGTPVLARPRGSVREVIDEGVTGLLFDTIEEGVEAVKKVGSIDRAGVRKRFEERFTAKIMADNYLALFEKIIEDNKKNH